MSILQRLQTQLAHAEIPFVEFMQQALYSPDEGYYSSSLAKFGAEGDFITAPELSPLFGYTLANQCEHILSALENPCILEFGAGSGALCVAILEQLEKLQALPKHYYILEVSAHLRARQEALVQEKIPHLASKVQWLTRWPETSFQGVVLANEVLDAMPVHRFLKTDDALLESYIALDAAGQLQERFKPANSRLQSYVSQHLDFIQAPYLSEVNLFIDSWLLQVYQMLEKGVVFLIDYGFPRHEYYHPDRHQGTVMCHYRHHSHPDFLVHVGEQDITAHVDFTHVAEAACDAGFHVAGFTNQASFLLANGLLSLVNLNDSERCQLKAKKAIKQLTHPSEMGELFKVIALDKKMDVDLQGFQLLDKRVSL